MIATEESTTGATVPGADSRRGIEVGEYEEDDNAAVVWIALFDEEFKVSLRLCPATAMGEGAIGRTY